MVLHSQEFTNMTYRISENEEKEHSRHDLNKMWYRESSLTLVYMEIRMTGRNGQEMIFMPRCRRPNGVGHALSNGMEEGVMMSLS